MSDENPTRSGALRARFTEDDFRATYSELIEENPLAVRAVLKILDVDFTDRVPTLAVTLEERPRLLVNLDFLSEHCRRGKRIDEKFVKAVICHEFLHVLLRHTECFKVLSPERHLALDAVINAIIHRDLGPEYSEFMRRYYRQAEGLQRLLRPPNLREVPNPTPWSWKRRPDWAFKEIWRLLYAGQLVADDIEEIARDMVASQPEDSPSPMGTTSDGEPAESGQSATPSLLGGHDPEITGSGTEGGEGEREEVAPTALGSGPIPDALARALDRSLESMNGSGIWRAPHARGVAATSYRGEFRGVDTGLARWKAETRKVLRRYLEPDRRGPREEVKTAHYTLPVLSTSDRRAALQAGWSPFLPNALWSTEVKGQSGTAQVYLDVSGSMNAEMPLIVSLLHGLGRYIRRPFWAFSNVVARAEIVDGRLEADTTGGTSMACVLEHVIQTRPSSAVVVTDGYIERLDPERVKDACAKTRLYALITRDGDGRRLHAAGVAFTQLGKVPQ